MERGATVALVAALFLGVILLGMVLSPPTPEDTDAYNRTTVTIEDTNGTTLGTVTVRIADTQAKRYVGLSNTSSLPMGEGMLFVHGRERSLTYVMRDMDFPLDIIFVGADGHISRIHHAPVPEEIPGGDGSFEGTGRYVLEVPRGWANETGVAVGDRVVIPDREHWS